MIKLCKKNISKISESEYFIILSRLPKNLREHIEKKKFFPDRVRSACAYALLLDALKEIYKEVPDIAFSESGKPYFKDIPLHFSISHSEDTVIAALSERKIGADIEKIREVPRGVAERFFTECEQKTDFFEIWTKKEAYGKCMGDMVSALKRDMTDLSFYTENDGEYAIAVYEE